ncbi:glycosyltransferase family 4 protein [Pedobacter cryophilus]|uniref:Glycosyltransferase family 4 protein n=1 Tax=Pedobacter cryophilus TaxID=2571271 RepID=A0A4U1C3N8_9SPHI|nr:glycosyltransferase family 1 protein [Pedobacter cryophilus]TKC00430.1 glycosyltransferase family 4 protein [Pedobacter cryophilus]
MIIAVNTRLLQKNNLEGIGRFTFETFKRMVLNHPEVDFIFCFDRKFDASFIFASNVKPLIIYPQARHPFLYYLWFEYALPNALKPYKVDVLLSPDGFIPLKSNIKTLAVIHDIAFEHDANGVDWLTQTYYKHYFPKFAKKANRIATVSTFSKQDIIKTYGINESKIDVVYNGVSAVFKALSLPEKEQVKVKITNGKPYFVYTGSIHPRKNIITLLKAFEALKKQHQVQHQLVLVGRKAWKNKELEQFLSQMTFKNEVIFTGKLSDEELSKVLASADVAVYPSTFEGFGLPVIEAFACGVPIITSKNTAMEEIAKGAAHLFNPLDDDELKNLLFNLITHPFKTEEKIKLGFKVAQSYTWDGVAEKLWTSLIKTTTC